MGVEQGRPVAGHRSLLVDSFQAATQVGEHDHFTRFEGFGEHGLDGQARVQGPLGQTGGVVDHFSIGSMSPQRCGCSCLVLESMALRTRAR